MPIISKPYGDFIALTPAEAVKVNGQVNALYNLVNGGLTDPNIAALANINQSKILNLVSDLATIRANHVGEVNVQTFTNTVGVNTYNRVSDLIFAWVIVIGGGGGGGSPDLAGAGFRAGGGGGGGAMAFSFLNVNAIGSTENVTVGGAGGPGATGNSGNPGGVTSFGSLVIAAGGTGGVIGLDNEPAQGGLGGSAAAGQLFIGGNDGWPGIAGGTTGAWIGGHGGASPMGGGGAGSLPSIAAGIGRNFGGGGGGGISNTTTNNLGAVGANGIVIVVEFKS